MPTPFAPGRVLVFGSQAPVTGPESDVATAVIRRAWEAGADVVTASPRASAADLVARITGPLAGYRLERVHRAAGGPESLVLCLDGGLLAPTERAVSVPRRVLDQANVVAAVLTLRRALRSFDHVSLALSGPTGLDRALLRPLWSLVDIVVVGPGGVAEAVRLGLSGKPTEHLDVAGTSAGVDGVTVVGPPEVATRDRAVWLLGLLGRRVLGRRFPYYRVHTIETARKLRRVARRSGRMVRPRGR
jgi:hypothetical protein